MKVSCFYSFKETCIIIGDVDDKKLVIESKTILKNQSVSDIVKVLKKYQNYRIYINKHETLKKSIPRCIEFDLLGENSEENQSLVDAWLSLKKEMRFITSNDFEIVNDNELSPEVCCLKTLLRAFSTELFRETEKYRVMATYKTRHKTSRPFVRSRYF